MAKVGNKNHKAKCEKYRMSGRREINKEIKQKKIAEGKRIKPKRYREKTLDMKWNTLLRGVMQKYVPPKKNSAESKKKIVLAPKNINKNCVR